ncbi:hypothetical protein ACT6QG_07010 [Xanthobacter sp. TB0136]
MNASCHLPGMAAFSASPMMRCASLPHNLAGAGAMTRARRILATYSSFSGLATPEAVLFPDGVFA